jgi:hypothetical protein
VIVTNYERVKIWRSKNKDKVAAQSRRYAAKHSNVLRIKAMRFKTKHIDEVRMRDAERARRRRMNNPEAQRLRNQAYLERQELKRVEIAGRPRPEYCELCGKQDRIVFDHCHESELFRGWICDRCNKVLGLVKDDMILLEKMIDYLLEAKIGKAIDSAA